MTAPIARYPSVHCAMPPLAAAHLVIGIAWLVAGVGLGIYMATSHDFLLRPVHAHANLLGWATNALFGLFYWLRGGVARRREWLGYAAFNLGGATMLAGLTRILVNDDVPAALMPVGTLLVAAGIVQMVVAIVGSVQRRRRGLAVAHA